MKRQHLHAILSMVLGAALCFCTAAGMAEQELVLENEYNVVEASIDTLHGIPDNAGGVLDRIRRKGVLRVATEPYFAPQEFIDPEKAGQDQYVGADMELARLIAQRMGVELEIVPMDFSQVLPALADDLCDLTISALAYTPGRANAYTLSKGYYYTDSTASTAFVIRETDAETIRTESDLAARRIIAQSSSLQEALAANHVKQYLEFRRVSSIQTVYDAVRTGKADAGIVDMETAENYIRSNPDCGLMIIPDLYYTLDEYFLGDRIAAKKDEIQLICFVNGVIDDVTADGTYMRWLEEAQKRANALGL